MVLMFGKQFYEDLLIIFTYTNSTCNLNVSFLVRSMIVTGPLFAMLALLSVGAGMVAFAYYQQRECDPI